MADLSIHPDYNALLEEAAELKDRLLQLIQERDELLFHTNQTIEAAYMIQIGTLELKAYEFECSVRRLKRKTELIQAKLNRQEPVFLPGIDEQLDLEYQVYTEQIHQRVEQISQAFKLSEGPFLSKQEAKELKRLYREIIKKLHPDIRPDLSNEQEALFLSAVSAYKNADLAVLRSISLLLMEISPQASSIGSMEELIIRRDVLLHQIRALEQHIGRIKASFPYSQKEMLADEARVKEKQQALMDRIEQYKAAYQQYEDRLADLLR